MPVRELNYETMVTEELWEEFVAGARRHYHDGAYDLIRNNCNHFSSACLEMLTSQRLPPEYTYQADLLEVPALASLFGAKLANESSQQADCACPPAEQYEADKEEAFAAAVRMEFHRIADANPTLDAEEAAQQAVSAVLLRM